MQRRNIPVLLLIAGGCASAPPPAPQLPDREPAQRVPVQPPPPRSDTTPPANPPSTLRQAAANWQLLEGPGIGAERAYRELLAGRQPRRTVVVAVIDGGIDTAHVDLRPNLWRNPRETANGRDDDNNGYVDDVYGWNFIGGKDGRNVHHDTFEVTRLFALCQKKAPEAARMPCDSIAASYQEKKAEAESTLAQINQIGPVYDQITRLLKQALNTDSLTIEKVEAFRPLSAQQQQARQIYLQLASNGITADVIREGKEEFENQLKYGLNPDYDPRPIVGDNYANPGERLYGNRDVTGPDAKHGTHVAGIIGAVRGNSQGIDGVAAVVRLMAVRAVPDGDERDKDVANAIRYAVDNGAHIINMSFGKGWSPQKQVVDAAAAYAHEKGVLLVHAAGNDGDDLAVNRNYPTAIIRPGTRIANWIEVGASSWKGADTLAAGFSNYGREQVDVFAPGEDILSTVPGGGTQRQSGTSMAAPVVSGLAALIWAYYPELTAADVKRAILESATRLGERMTVRPGAEAGEKVPFSTLSATGAIVNAVAALRLAEQIAAAKAR